MQPDPSMADIAALLHDQKPGIYTHRCGAKDFMIPVLPGPGVARWCAACRASDEDWTRDPDPPRVYAMPNPPTDPNTRVRDRRGNVWHLAVACEWRVVGRPAQAAEWFGLLAHYGPLTEVTDAA